jgi:Fe-S-cluster-containing dehydrogenase component/CRP-like cAMP-binding protein
MVEVINPPPEQIDHAPREPGDEYLTADELKKSISLFKDLVKPPSFEKYPGTVLLRRCSPGRILCRQGEPGSSAFYILKREDVIAICQRRAESIEAVLAERERPAGVGGDDLAMAPQKETEKLHPYLSQRTTEELRDLQRTIDQELNRPQTPNGEADATGDAAERAPVAFAQLFTAFDDDRVPSGLLGRFLSGLRLRSTPSSARAPRSIANDGPRDLETSKDLRAPLFEGELFGEMSCINHAPRSATVITERDCYVLEMVRWLLDFIRTDPIRKHFLDENYRKHVLELHLRKINVFAELTDDELESVRQGAQLIDVDPGSVLFEEHDPSDACYVIRTGLIKVIEGTNCKLRPEEFTDDNWAQLWKLWGCPAEDQGELVRAFWGEFERIRAQLAKTIERKDKAIDSIVKRKLPEAPAAAKNNEAAAESVLQHLRAERDAVLATDASIVAVEAASRQAAGQAAAGQPLTDQAKGALLAALNVFIQQGRVHEDAEIKKDKKPVPLPAPFGTTKSELLKAVRNPEFVAAAVRLPELAERWSELESWLFHRLFVETAFSAGLPRRAVTSRPRRVLSYQGRGDVIGEIGLLRDQPRNATCIAFDHPDDDPRQKIPDERSGAALSHVELLRIEKKLFDSLTERSENFRKRIAHIATSRIDSNSNRSHQTKRSARHSSIPVADRPEFEDLGLYQGQKLMLIDLDRCTRCGSCVDACVKVHRDGRTRLYLDGPRFGSYLVPLTCRQCHDPVCMIGCPVGSIVKGENGEIRIENWCIGCATCADQCPYGSIQMESLRSPIKVEDYPTDLRQLIGGADLKTVTDRAVVCDLCSSVPGQDPACVYACPHDAALRVNADEFFVSARTIRSEDTAN